MFGAIRALCIYFVFQVITVLCKLCFCCQSKRTSCRLIFSNQHSSLSPLSPFISLPKYFESEWSYARYRIPVQTSHLSLSASSTVPDIAADAKCVVSWIRVTPKVCESVLEQEPAPEFQLIVLTLSGCWYRLSLPQPSAISDKKVWRRLSDNEKRKGEDVGKSNECSLLEFRHYGHLNGWSD